MTQHSLELDSNSNEKEPVFESLSDTWSRADALLEELPRERARKEPRRVADEAQASSARVIGGPKSDMAPEQAVEEAGQSGLKPREGLLRK